jgi:adenosylcobinamide-phosphate synthase
VGPAGRSRTSQVGTRVTSPTFRFSQNALAAAAGIAADLALGEPAVDPHPVAAFGHAMDEMEKAFYRPQRSAGVLHAAAGLGLGILAGTTLVRSTALATYLSVAQRALGEAAFDVAEGLDVCDLPLARQLLPALVGRDPSALDASEIARAVVESVAENTVDAVVAPALWAALFGASGALGYRAVNTMDATVGHHNERYEQYGWASARLDDLANYLPARLTAVLVMVVRPRSARAVWRAIRQDAPSHPSPNAGVAEAAFAAALGLRLGGVNTYGDRVEWRPRLGDGRTPEVADIRAAVSLGRDVTAGLIGTLIAWAALVGVAQRGRRTRRSRRSQPQ